jgi:hypothetical protein
MECLGERELTKATRVHDGIESDQYVCEKGHRFGIDWRGKPAEAPQWPPSPELVEVITSSY